MGISVAGGTSVPHIVIVMFTFPHLGKPFHDDYIPLVIEISRTAWTKPNRLCSFLRGVYLLSAALGNTHPVFSGILKWDDYKGKKIREYLKDSRIELLYLPPYAPNLNLIERVWKFFKKKVLANTYYETFPEFREACKTFFLRRTWSSHQAELDILLVDSYQIINV